MIEGIADLWDDVQRLARPVASHRNPGVGRDVIEGAFGEPVPDDVADWFGFSDGIAHYDGQTQDDAALVPGYEPLSVQESVAIRREYPHEPLYLAQWYPLLGSGGGDFYAACFDPETDRSYVVSVFIGEDPRIAYKSITQMIDVFRACFRDGTFYVDDEGVLQADDEQWLEREAQAMSDL